MSAGLALLAVLLADAAPMPVRLEKVAEREAVRVVVESGPRPVLVGRASGEIRVTIEGAFVELPAMPPPVAPITALKAEKDAQGFVVAISVPDDVTYEIGRDARALAIVLMPPIAHASDLSTAELYRRILPVPLVETAEATGGVEEAGAQPAGGTLQKDATRGLTLGPVTLRPWLALGYVDDQVAAGANAQPQREHHYEAEPRLSASAPLGAGALKVVYAPRFRWGSSLSVVNETSHLVDSSLGLPLSRRLELDVQHHFVQGALETSEVDRGGEYFFNLSRFMRQQLALGARAEMSASLALEAKASAARVRFAESRTAGFFDYDEREVSLRLTREMTPNLRLGGGLRYDELDSAERPLAVMHATSAEAILRGDLAPLTRAEIAAGYSFQENPNVTGEGRTYRGFVANLAIERDLALSSNLRLTGTRATHASDFEDNGYYVTTAGGLELSVPLPFSLSFRGGTGYHVNRYRVVRIPMRSPREDRIFGWSVGLARAIGRWGFLRADYSRDQRRSNVPELSNTVHSLILRLGVGLFEETQAR